jgi:hypothetical protein
VPAALFLQGVARLGALVQKGQEAGKAAAEAATRRGSTMMIFP